MPMVPVGGVPKLLVDRGIADVEYEERGGLSSRRQHSELRVACCLLTCILPELRSPLH